MIAVRDTGGTGCTGGTTGTGRIGRSGRTGRTGGTTTGTGRTGRTGGTTTGTGRTGRTGRTTGTGRIGSGGISRRGLRGALAVLSTCGLVLTASCATPRPQQPRAAALAAAAAAAREPGGTDPTAGAPEELRRYYEQRLDWKACQDVPDFQCATVTVPLDYAHPQAGDIHLTAARVRATGNGRAGVGTLQVNPGGPGESAIDYLVAAVGTFSPAMRSAYDLVALDPRGVQYSTPVDCATDTAATPMGFGLRLSGDATEITDSYEAFEELADACEKYAGRLLPHLGTPDAARDMDVVRALTGDKRLHYLGYSYGTYLGATYAELFPSRVGRMVLDGAIDPALDGYRENLESTAGYQLAWESFAADCAARPDCPVGHTVDEAGRVLNTLRDRLDRTPLRHGKDITITGEDLVTAVITALREASWEELRTMLRQVLAGDIGSLQQFADTDENGSGNAADALLAIDCLSSTLGARFSSAQAQAALPAFLAASPQFGESLATFLVLCTHWPVPATQAPHPIAASGAAPILVVGTTRDPATPYPWARSLARQLDSGRLLTYDGDGHTAYHRGSTCIDDAVDHYLTEGGLPPVGTVCD
ncbi:alpha/beta hydrolase [Streptomyces sp. NPDC026673]|uniref:alpha/beta hydrolase n=1 Tax=Streptomyces sp. NPDC026673 TaxID=3155724 RepID=UPI0033CA726C